MITVFGHKTIVAILNWRFFHSLSLLVERNNNSKMAKQNNEQSKKKSLLHPIYTLIFSYRTLLLMNVKIWNRKEEEATHIRNVCHWNWNIEWKQPKAKRYLLLALALWYDPLFAQKIHRTVKLVFNLREITWHIIYFSEWMR